MKIQESVEKILKNWPFARWGLKEGLINASALARRIEPEVSKMIGKKPSSEAVLVSIYNFQDGLEKVNEEIEGVVRESYFSVESGVATVNTEVDGAMAVIKGLKKTVSIIRTVEVPKGLGAKKGLSILRIMLSDKAMETPGVIEHFTYLVSSNGINIHEMESANTELLFVIDEKEAPRAFEILRGSISDYPDIRSTFSGKE